MELYHGAHTAYRLHEGQCYTDYLSVASAYAGSTGELATVEIDLDALTVEDCPGYDHDADDCPADHAEYRRTAAERGVDVLRYEDEDIYGRVLDCYRLVSERALAAVRLVSVTAAHDMAA